MINCRTPYRISFFGGGTDYPVWYQQHGGAVLSTSIDKYCYLSCRYLPPFFEHRYRIVWSHIEQAKSLDDILHPVIPKMVEYLGIEEGLEISHIGDLPARSGMGSSSAFVVGLLQGLNALKGNIIGKEELLAQSLEMEQNLLKENVGSQDQTAAVYGGFNKISFQTNGDINVSPVTVKPEHLVELNDNLMLFYTGISRSASKIAGKLVSAITAKEFILHRMREMVEEGLDILCQGRDINEFGRLLDQSWKLKKSIDPSISTTICDQIYQVALDNGAIGGKLLGAGGGGFMLFFVPPEKQAQVLSALARLVYVPFRFENDGTRIIHYDTEPNTVRAIQDERCESNTAYHSMV